MLKGLVVLSWLTIIYIVVVFFNNVNLVVLKKTLNDVALYKDWYWFVGLVLLSMVLRGLRWILFFNSILMVRKSELFMHHGWFFILSMMSLVRSGEANRVLWLKDKGMTPSLSISYILIEKLSDAFILSIFLIIGFVLVSNINLGFSILVGFTCITAYIAVSLYGRQAHQTLEGLMSTVKSTSIQKALYFLGKIALIMTMLKSKRFNLSLLMFTVFIWFCVVCSFHLFITAQYSHVPFYASTLIVAMVNLTGVLNLTPANIGPFELSVVLVLMFYGVDELEASIFAVTLHFLVMGATISYGIICKGLIMARSIFNRQV